MIGRHSRTDRSKSGALPPYLRLRRSTRLSKLSNRRRFRRLNRPPSPAPLQKPALVSHGAPSLRRDRRAKRAICASAVTFSLHIHDCGKALTGHKSSFALRCLESKLAESASHGTEHGRQPQPRWPHAQAQRNCRCCPHERRADTFIKALLVFTDGNSQLKEEASDPQRWRRPYFRCRPWLVMPYTRHRKHGGRGRII